MNGQYCFLHISVPNIRQIKNAIRVAQATVASNDKSLNYAVLKDTLEVVGDLGDIEACDRQQGNVQVGNSSERDETNHAK